MKYNAVTLAATGQSTTTTISTATAAAVIPVSSSGSKPRYVRMTATGPCHVRLAPSAGLAVAVTTDAMLQAGQELVIAAQGNTHWSAIDRGVAVTVNIVPLEDS